MDSSNHLYPNSRPWRDGNAQPMLTYSSQPGNLHSSLATSSDLDQPASSYSSQQLSVNPSQSAGTCRSVPGVNPACCTSRCRTTDGQDYGPNPYVVNIEDATLENPYFRRALWTGNHLQLTLMCIGVGQEIGLEIHPERDQFLRLEQGQGIAMMGSSQNNLTYQQNVASNSAIFIPAGTWHNVMNTGTVPMKLYSIYAAPQHPHGRIHCTRADDDE